MKKFVFITAVLIATTHSSAFAAKMNCKKISNEIESLQLDAQKQQKEINSIDTQLESGAKALNDFNKNCRGVSKPNCNPAMYNMISLQMTSLNGQRQKVQGQLLDAANKQEEAKKSLSMCNSVKVKKTTL